MSRKIIAICNEKGGSGKTTTAICLSMAFAKLGKKVLAIELDGQGNMSRTFGFVFDRKPTIAELIQATVAELQVDYDMYIRQSQYNVDFIPARDRTISGVTGNIGADPDSGTVLRRAIVVPETEKYDIIIIDCIIIIQFFM